MGLATLQGTAYSANAVARVRYSHDAMIDLIIAEPMIKQNALAAHFGVTPAWMSRIVNSDAFLARLAQRKADVVDPILISNMEEKLRGLMDQSVEVIAEKLEATKSPELALRALELSGKALGYGARKDNIAVQNNFVVALPPKAETAAAWTSQYRPGGGQATDAVEVSSSTRVATRDLDSLAIEAGIENG